MTADASGKVRIGALDDFTDGQLHTADAAGISVIVGAVDGTLYAARNHCPHLGFSLTKGPGGRRFADGDVTCPWHNSRFELRTGENRDWTPGFAGTNMPRWSRRLIALGKKPAPLTTYPVTVQGEDVFVQVPAPNSS